MATPPEGTARRIRTRAIWTVALFAAAVPPALVGLGGSEGRPELRDGGMALALLFWAIGLLFALATAVPTLRHWDGLPAPVRWMGALPLLSISLLLSLALVAVLFVGA